MLRLLLFLLALLSTPISALSQSPRPPRLPTVFIAGDSTTAPGGGHNGTEGWGQYLQYSLGNVPYAYNDTNLTLSSPVNQYFTAFVNNSAVAGTSARSFTRGGNFASMENHVQAGDWVIIEFGHNDGSSPYPAADDNGRGDCPGAGNETCPTVYDNQTEIVQTYPTYIKQASSVFLAKGARVVISSPTPDNPWETGNFTYSPNRFTYYSWLAASELGGPAKGVYFVDHGQYTAQMMQNLGATAVDENYPMDHTHTAPYLADFVAQAFVLGLKCGTSGLADLVVNATSRLDLPVLGNCVLVNATLPI